jgi:hypothetical protein
MSDHICMVCEHGPHRKAPCTACGCTQWVNAAVRSAQALTTLNNLLQQEIPKISMMLVDLVEIIAESNPEAVERIDERRAEMRKQLEEQAASQQQGSATDQTGQDPDTSSGDGEADTAGAAGV